jgi:hypothetical protein
LGRWAGGRAGEEGRGIKALAFPTEETAAANTSTGEIFTKSHQFFRPEGTLTRDNREFSIFNTPSELLTDIYVKWRIANKMQPLKVSLNFRMFVFLAKLCL